MHPRNMAFMRTLYLLHTSDLQQVCKVWVRLHVCLCTSNGCIGDVNAHHVPAIDGNAQ